MIDSEFIIRYTNALYSTAPEYAPRYDEFRDMFSSGQIRSKEWLVKELYNLGIIHNQSFVIAGSWFGTLGILLKKQFSSIDITLLDLDPRCEIYTKNIVYDISGVAPITEDMYAYKYTQDVVINTSCEHIPDINNWLNLIPANTILILQSNNYLTGNGHINCVNSIEEFNEQTKLNRIMYLGELTMPMYTRYMIIGTT